jgi:hypothetical protein
LWDYSPLLDVEEGPSGLPNNESLPHGLVGSLMDRARLENLDVQTNVHTTHS